MCPNSGRGGTLASWDNLDCESTRTLQVLQSNGQPFWSVSGTVINLSNINGFLIPLEKADQYN